MYVAKASLVNQPVKVNVHFQRAVAMIAKLPNAFLFHVLEKLRAQNTGTSIGRERDSRPENRLQLEQHAHYSMV